MRSLVRVRLKLTHVRCSQDPLPTPRNRDRRVVRPVHAANKAHQMEDRHQLAEFTPPLRMCLFSFRRAIDLTKPCRALEKSHSTPCSPKSFAASIRCGTTDCMLGKPGYCWTPRAHNQTCLSMSPARNPLRSKPNTTRLPR